MEIAFGYNMDPLDGRESSICHFITSRQALLTPFLINMLIFIAAFQYF